MVSARKKHMRNCGWQHLQSLITTMACCLLSWEKIVLKASKLWQLHFFARKTKGKLFGVNTQGVRCKAPWAFIMIAGNFDVIKITTWTCIENSKLLLYLYCYNIMNTIWDIPSSQVIACWDRLHMQIDIQNMYVYRWACSSTSVYYILKVVNLSSVKYLAMHKFKLTTLPYRA